MMKKSIFILAFFLINNCSAISSKIQEPTSSNSNLQDNISLSKPQDKTPNMYVQLRFKGFSDQLKYKCTRNNAWVNKVELQIYRNGQPVSGAFVTIIGWVNGYMRPGYDSIYGFADPWGEYFDTEFWASDPLLYTKNNKIEFYQWIFNGAFLFERKRISITIPEGFDPTQHTNIARFTVYNYKDTGGYNILFDGFLPKPSN